MTKAAATPIESKTALISQTAPHRSVFAFFQRWEWGLVLLIGAVVLLNSQLSPYFLDVDNLSRTSSDFMEIGIVLLLMVFIIVSGNIDLSVASTLGMCASFMGWLFMQGVDIWVAALAALVLGSLAGLLNGVLVARVGLPALVVTLGTYAFYRGIAYVLLGDQAARNYPDAFTYLGQGKVGDTPLPFAVPLFLVLALILGLVLHQTTYGRYLFAIGNNEKAAAYSGVRVARFKMIAFTLSGFMSALAGLILAARFGSTRPDIGMGMELSVITATVLGGVDINGGTGTMIGPVLSLVLIGLTRFGMGLQRIPGQVQGVVIGLLLILSILIPNIVRRLFASRVTLSRRSVLATLVVVVVLVIFFVFFFWSRAPLLGTT